MTPLLSPQAHEIGKVPGKDQVSPNGIALSCGPLGSAMIDRNTTTAAMLEGHMAARYYSSTWMPVRSNAALASARPNGRRSKRKHSDLGKRPGESTDVVWITRGNYRSVELKGSRHHKRIDCMGGRELQSGEHLSRLLRGGPVQVNNTNAWMVQ